MKGRGEMGDTRGNPPTSGVVRHDSHMRKSGSTLEINLWKMALPLATSTLKGAMFGMRSVKARLHSPLYTQASAVCSLAAAPESSRRLHHTWQYGTCYVFTCKPGNGSETSRAAVPAPSSGVSAAAAAAAAASLPPPAALRELYAAAAAGHPLATQLASQQQRLLELSRFGLRHYDLAQHVLSQQGAVTKLLGVLHAERVQQLLKIVSCPASYRLFKVE
ncbi:hypothetical protein PR048_028155 [Dryococelus australis]|uniref:Uncharacterized protein n=1 Tax=Dryococelus australis TaxID=614101 RepID=A0ABQ9GIG2_9NEOP|nr:hypothetical protein PR048_028155 [Dryococelus australis]